MSDLATLGWPGAVAISSIALAVALVVWGFAWGSKR